MREVSPAALRLILERLALPEDGGTVPLLTAESGKAVTIAASPGRFRILGEDDEVVEGWAADCGNGNVRIDAPTRAGYYRLELDDEVRTVAVAPPRGWTVADATNGRAAWGLAVQLYALRRDGDGGLGDFAALADLARRAAAVGAATIAISPVHAGFTALPLRFSPYAPSSRSLLNGLYADPGERFRRDDDASLVEWAGVAKDRCNELRRVFSEAMGGSHPGLLRDFERFRSERGRRLELHAVFEALHAAQLGSQAGIESWRQWPAPLRDPGSTAVAEFAAAHREEVDFHAFVQFVADRGLGNAQRAAIDGGMPIGLITDLAVGVDSGGSDAWAEPSQLLHGLSIGAPGDILNPQGQDWGVTTFSPHGLVAHGYAAFLEMLRTALRHAGGVRIDHVMGLARLWVVPEGGGPADGAYLRFPLDDMLRLVRLESLRHRAIVIGEDLGTVPEGFQESLQSSGLAGMRVLWFEREGDRFKPPERWSADAVAMTTTHDLPTVAGWWRGLDVAWQRRLGRGDPDRSARARVQERAALWEAFQASGAAAGELPAADDTQPVVDAACAHIAASACALALLPIEDALGLEDQPNLPGTVDEHPNWRRRLPAPADALFADPVTAARLRALSEARPI